MYVIAMWLTQWGSKSLGDQGFSAIEILRHFYGSDMYINTAEQIAGVPSSWPGYTLTVGSSGDKVRQMQEQLDVIAEVYSAIPRIAADGIYGPMTQSAVREFNPSSTCLLPGMLTLLPGIKSHRYMWASAALQN